MGFAPSFLRIGFNRIKNKFFEFEFYGSLKIIYSSLKIWSRMIYYISTHRLGLIQRLIQSENMKKKDLDP